MEQHAVGILVDIFDLEAITARVRKRNGLSVQPMQLAALLLERSAERLSTDEAEELVDTRRRASR